MNMQSVVCLWRAIIVSHLKRVVSNGDRRRSFFFEGGITFFTNNTRVDSGVGRPPGWGPRDRAWLSTPTTPGCPKMAVATFTWRVPWRRM